MKFAHMVGVAFVAGVIAAPSMAAPDVQPPMDGFNNAFYNCDKDRSFLLSYDSDHPTSATMTTNNDNKQYVLKRTPSDNGAQFSGDTVQFWTDGASVVVKGTERAYQNCKRKTS